MHQIAWRPWAEGAIPRRFCSGQALISDGRWRRVDYSIIEDGGMIGATWGVQWCVLGLDRNWAYHPAARWRGPDAASQPAPMPSVLRAIAIAAVLGATSGGAPAQEQRQHQPGQFDFYVLALSWSPSFCEATAERGRNPPREQCGARPYSFVVHGLWPQYERGFPSDCQVPAPRLDRNIMSSMLDMMPAPRLVYHEWDKHGTCSGLSARAYFDSCARHATRSRSPRSTPLRKAISRCRPTRSRRRSSRPIPGSRAAASR